ncbi:mycofactocin system transcriptional regulator [Patulibacter sp. SYSU D01012]|uniref:mycofactocin system transcriptional regulator n=1 Tax=Patulibacter sp. SYSU D01012 TaxID=2817381 RepID=UPI001B300817|nr:mycofactocin system transcriptional regulator [Patulibacter sp. SYSU D01012]
MARTQAGGPPLVGRPRATTPLSITQASLALFDRQGYEETTVDEIARAAGISRRTLFRYFPSKHDIVWGDFSAHVARFRASLDDAPADEPTMTVLRRCVVQFNDYGPDAEAELRTRMRLITTVPALQGHAMLRHQEWCDAIAAFVAARRGGRPTDLEPTLVAQAALGVSTGTFRVWIADGGDLLTLLDDGFRRLAEGFPDPD